jgi:hypothetical protein
MLILDYKFDEVEKLYDIIQEILEMETWGKHHQIGRLSRSGWR